MCGFSKLCAAERPQWKMSLKDPLAGNRFEAFNQNESNIYKERRQAENGYRFNKTLNFEANIIVIHEPYSVHLPHFYTMHLTVGCVSVIKASPASLLDHFRTSASGFAETCSS